MELTFRLVPDTPCLLSIPRFLPLLIDYANVSQYCFSSCYRYKLSGYLDTRVCNRMLSIFYSKRIHKL